MSICRYFGTSIFLPPLIPAKSSKSFPFVHCPLLYRYFLVPGPRAVKQRPEESEHRRVMFRDWIRQKANLGRLHLKRLHDGITSATNNWKFLRLRIPTWIKSLQMHCFFLKKRSLHLPDKPFREGEPFPLRTLPRSLATPSVVLRTG